MRLPGRARTHVWLGLLAALAGVILGGYAYTGDRIYELVYLPLALLGLALLVAGSALAGYGQANRPRLGGRQEEEDEEPGLLTRLRARLTGDEDQQADEGEGEPEDEPASSEG